MLFEETFKTIGVKGEAELKIKGSRFIGQAYPVSDEETIKNILQEAKAEHIRANHHCYAFRLGPDHSAYRYSDDREPSGSAGKPIFGVIRSAGITNVLIVVIRYFGGTLLGVPGLISAYRDAAAAALEKCTIIESHIVEKYMISYPYDLIKEMDEFLRLHHVEVTNRNMHTNCVLTVKISKSKADEFLKSISNYHIFQNKITIKPVA